MNHPNQKPKWSSQLSSSICTWCLSNPGVITAWLLSSSCSSISSRKSLIFSSFFSHFWGLRGMTRDEAHGFISEPIPGVFTVHALSKHFVRTQPQPSPAPATVEVAYPYHGTCSATWTRSNSPAWILRNFLRAHVNRWKKTSAKGKCHLTSMFLYVSLCKNAFLIRPVGKWNKSGGVWYSGVHHKFQAGKCWANGYPSPPRKKLYAICLSIPLFFPHCRSYPQPITNLGPAAPALLSPHFVSRPLGLRPFAVPVEGDPGAMAVPWSGMGWLFQCGHPTGILTNLRNLYIPGLSSDWRHPIFDHVTYGWCQALQRSRCSRLLGIPWGGCP